MSHLCGHMLADGTTCREPIADPHQSTCGRHQPLVLGPDLIQPAPPSAEVTKHAPLGTRQHPLEYEGCRLWWDPASTSARSNLFPGWHCLVHEADNWQVAESLGGPKGACETRELSEEILEHAGELAPGAILSILRYETRERTERLLSPIPLSEPLVEALRDQYGTLATEIIARHPQVPPDAIARLVQDPTVPPRIRRMALQNPCAPEAVLQQVARQARRIDTRMAVAANPKAPASLLKRLIGRSWMTLGGSDDALAYWVGVHPNTPARLMKHLARSGYYGAIAVASNPAVPDKLLRELSYSDVDPAADIAKRHIEARRQGQSVDFRRTRPMTV